jgi:hypothetical protein
VPASPPCDTHATNFILAQEILERGHHIQTEPALQVHEVAAETDVRFAAEQENRTKRRELEFESEQTRTRALHEMWY